ncbi:MAG: hypothetical protein GY816_12950 [Cytophagales bacterium]|nr:hypothetical protein [Cytophagales bacterium]
MLFKVILFFFLFCYAVYRIGGFLIKFITFNSTGSKSRVHKKGNIRVDKQQKNGKSHYDGGDYVDFEEVK